MMQQKLLKLAKGLNKFELDEIAILMETEPQELKETIEELVNDRYLKQSGSCYLYINKTRKKHGSKTVPAKIKEIKPDDNLYDEYKNYVNAPMHIKNGINKALKILEVTNGLTGKALQDCIKNWNKDKPKEKVNIKTVMTMRNRFKKEGIRGLVTYKQHNQSYPDEIFNYFVNYYLKPEKLSASKALHKAIKKFKQYNPDFDTSTLPGTNAFYKKLKHHYPTDKISYFRNKVLQVDKLRRVQYASLTFREAADEYLKYSGEICRATTLKYYECYLSNHLNPYFGHKILCEISLEDIENYKKLKKGKGLASKTVNNHISLAGTVICKYNKDFKIKKLITDNKYSEAIFLEKEQIKLLLKIAKSDYPDFYPLIFTAINTGITRSEIIALQWEDIDWQDYTITVNKSIFKGEFQTHTTKYSKREVRVSQKLLTELQKWQKLCPKGEHNLVFPNIAGDIYDADNMIKRKFTPLCKKAGLENLKFCDLRDTYAALLIKQNFPLTYIQQQLGHSSVNVTAERYKSLIPDVKIKSLEII